MAETLRGYHERSGHTCPFTEHLVILPLVPYTRWQRLLHRLRICRWHTHQEMPPFDAPLAWTPVLTVTLESSDGPDAPWVPLLPTGGQSSRYDFPPGVAWRGADEGHDG
jgi:hypothetical protein